MAPGSGSGSGMGRLCWVSRGATLGIQVLGGSVGEASRPGNSDRRMRRAGWRRCAPLERLLFRRLGTSPRCTDPCALDETERRLVPNALNLPDNTLGRRWHIELAEAGDASFGNALAFLGCMLGARCPDHRFRLGVGYREVSTCRGTRGWPCSLGAWSGNPKLAGFAPVGACTSHRLRTLHATFRRAMRICVKSPASGDLGVRTRPRSDGGGRSDGAHTVLPRV